MSTSPTDGVIPYDPSIFATDEPLGTARVHDSLLASALHKADMMAQHRAGWVAVVDTLQVGNVEAVEVPRSYYASGDETALPVAATDVPQWQLFGCPAVYVPKVRADGSGYPLRVRVGGRSSDGGRVDFGVVVAPRLATPAQILTDVTAAQKLYTDVTSTTIAWLTPDDGSHMLEVPKGLIDRALGLESAWVTKTDIGGDRTSLVAPSVQVVPFSQTWSVGTVPELYGFAAQEYIGV